jgi:predicted nucleotidyltransferase
MASIVNRVYHKNLREMPSFVSTTQYETITGSIAYGVNEDWSDMDIYTFCIPPKHYVFEQIKGFKDDAPNFDSWQQHHIRDDEKNREYDIEVFNITKFFSLLMDNNPNMVDTLYTPQNCVLHTTEIGRKVGLNRHLFLHKGAFHRFRGYAFAQLKKTETKEPVGKRAELIRKYGFDVKFASNIVRLSDECEQILTTGDLDLTRSKEMQKAIRRGEIPFDEIKKWFFEKEKSLEKLYHSDSSPIPHRPDVKKIKGLLLECLEDHYGSVPVSVEAVESRLAGQMIKILKEQGYLS